MGECCILRLLVHRASSGCADCRSPTGFARREANDCFWPLAIKLPPRPTRRIHTRHHVDWVVAVNTAPTASAPVEYLPLIKLGLIAGLLLVELRLVECPLIHTTAVEVVHGWDGHRIHGSACPRGVEHPAVGGLNCHVAVHLSVGGAAHRKNQYAEEKNQGFHRSVSHKRCAGVVKKTGRKSAFTQKSGPLPA